MNEVLAGIGHRISSARKSKKMTQEALAELADVSYQTISSAELGKKALRPENIIKISQALQVSTLIGFSVLLKTYKAAPV